MRNQAKQSIWRGRFFRYAPLFLWIALIFFLSSGQGAMSNTSRFIRPLLIFLFPDAAEETLALYHGFIRKLAHPTVYAGLAFFAFRVFSLSSKEVFRKFWFAFSLLLVLTVASLDELNQSRLASRTGSPFDVLLDTAGGLIMLGALYFYDRRRAGKNGF